MWRTRPVQQKAVVQVRKILTGCDASVRKARIWSGATRPSGTVRPLRLRSCVSAVARSCSRATTSPDMPMGAAPPPAGASDCTQPTQLLGDSALTWQSYLLHYDYFQFQNKTCSLREIYTSSLHKQVVPFEMLWFIFIYHSYTGTALDKTFFQIPMLEQP